jgi:hypothetical protein
VGYDFGDADGDSEILSGGNATSYRWMLDGTPISGASSPEYTVGASDAGKSLAVEVTPKTDPAITDPAVGMPVLSTAFAVGEADQPTRIEIHNNSGAITSRPIVGEVLTATPICPAACATDLVYTWSVDGANVGSGQTYTPTKDDQKKVITVSTPTVR